MTVLGRSIIHNFGCNFENIIHLFKNADHFDLMEPAEKNATSQNSGDQGYADVGGEPNFYQWRVGMLFTIFKVILFTYKNGCTLSGLIYARI